MAQTKEQTGTARTSPVPANESPQPNGQPKHEPISALRGLGAGIWSDVDPVEYVRSLREG